MFPISCLQQKIGAKHTQANTISKPHFFVPGKWLWAPDFEGDVIPLGRVILVVSQI